MNTDNSTSIIPRKLHIKTWGCQMNVYDSARMADVLRPLGYTSTDEAAEADLVIFNTCHIREKATEKLFSELGRIRLHKIAARQAGREMLVAVAGCVAQAEGEEIRTRAPYVDMVFGPQTYHTLPEMIARVMRGTGSVLNTDFPLEAKFDFLPEVAACQGSSAFLSIQEGCDRFCSFCVVPYTRGAEYSRPTSAIVAEAERLVAGGAREIIVLGQNVNAWHGQDNDGNESNLAQLLERLARLDGVSRLRYTTSHPNSMSDNLINAHGNLPKLMPFLHLPVQSGSDLILEAMNRRHTAADYLCTVARLRQACPHIGLSTDIIVGFPGESDADFRATMALVREVEFAQAYSFIYSPRHGTPAAAMEGQVPDAVKAERLTALQELLRQQQTAFNARSLGQTVPVLFEGAARSGGNAFGRTPYMQGVRMAAADPESMRGREMQVLITTTGPDILDGTAGCGASSSPLGGRRG